LLQFSSEPFVFSSAVKKYKTKYEQINKYAKNLPVVLYRRETRYLTLREQHRLKVFQDRVLRRIFGPKRDEIIGGLEKIA
jgi:hypothetical protein